MSKAILSPLDGGYCDKCRHMEQRTVERSTLRVCSVMAGRPCWMVTACTSFGQAKR